MERVPSINVLGGPLEPCSKDPLTGFFRDGCCDTGPADFGLHVVCAVMTVEFLAFSKTRGNDLSTARPELGFPGLWPGERWCVCARARRWPRRWPARSGFRACWRCSRAWASRPASCR